MSRTARLNAVTELSGPLALARSIWTPSPDGHRVRPVFLALALVGATTLFLHAIVQVVGLRHVSILYLIPVLLAATRLGMLAAIVAAVGGVAASAFFFYAPLYDLRVADPQNLVDLTLFTLVAVVTSQLTLNERRYAAAARAREEEIRSLYAFSKQLAAATEPREIYAAIEQHLGSITGRRVVYVEMARSGPTAAVHVEDTTLPAEVRRALEDVHSAGAAGGASVLVEDKPNSSWLVRPVSPAGPEYGLLAIDMGGGSETEPFVPHHRIDEVLAEAASTLERLDVARAISEAKLRAEADTLREALMGSVSHGLRTPLASIVGSASILASSPAVAGDPRLASLSAIVRDEAERLNKDIQKLLDASRISSAGVRPNLTWADPADIVNATLAGQRRNLSAHEVSYHLSEDLPLVRVDPVLVEQALGQIIDNAAKYSPAGLRIRIEAKLRGDRVEISVEDVGSGLTSEERRRMFEPFYRGPRSRVTGSGLGLWIARAFVVASGGSLEAYSRGAEEGTVVTMMLPAPSVAVSQSDGDSNE